MNELPEYAKQYLKRLELLAQCVGVVVDLNNLRKSRLQVALKFDRMISNHDDKYQTNAEMNMKYISLLEKTDKTGNLVNAIEAMTSLGSSCLSKDDLAALVKRRLSSENPEEFYRSILISRTYVLDNGAEINI